MLPALLMLLILIPKPKTAGHTPSHPLSAMAAAVITFLAWQPTVTIVLLTTLYAADTIVDRLNIAGHAIDAASLYLDAADSRPGTLTDEIAACSIFAHIDPIASLALGGLRRAVVLRLTTLQITQQLALPIIAALLTCTALLAAYAITSRATGIPIVTILLAASLPAGIIAYNSAQWARAWWDNFHDGGLGAARRAARRIRERITAAMNPPAPQPAPAVPHR